MIYILRTARHVQLEVLFYKRELILTDSTRTTFFVLFKRTRDDSNKDLYELCAHQTNSVHTFQIFHDSYASAAFVLLLP